MLEAILIDNSFDPTKDEFRLANSPFYLIAHADFRYHAEMEEVMAKRGVTKTIYRILTVLRETRCSSVTELSDIALTKRATVSRVVDRMVKSGLVSTAPMPTDNRVTEVRLTAKGRDVLDELTPIVKRQLERALHDIPEAELQGFIGTLRAICRNLSKSHLE